MVIIFTRKMAKIKRGFYRLRAHSTSSGERSSQADTSITERRWSGSRSDRSFFVRSAVYNTDYKYHMRFSTCRERGSWE